MPGLFATMQCEVNQLRCLIFPFHHLTRPADPRCSVFIRGYLRAAIRLSSFAVPPVRSLASQHIRTHRTIAERREMEAEEGQHSSGALNQQSWLNRLNMADVEASLIGSLVKTYGSMGKRLGKELGHSASGWPKLLLLIMAPFKVSVCLSVCQSVCVCLCVCASVFG